MTGNEMTSANITKLWHLLSADWHCAFTSSLELASCRGIDRTWHFTFKTNLFGISFLLDLWIRNRNYWRQMPRVYRCCLCVPQFLKWSTQLLSHLNTILQHGLRYALPWTDHGQQINMLIPCAFADQSMSLRSVPEWKHQALKLAHR